MLAILLFFFLPVGVTEDFFNAGRRHSWAFRVRVVKRTVFFLCCKQRLMRYPIGTLEYYTAAMGCGFPNVFL